LIIFNSKKKEKEKKMELNEWIKRNEIHENIIWKETALNQLEAFNSTGQALGLKAQVIHHHTSKNIKLPVVMYQLNDSVSVIARSNFYDIKVSIKSDVPLNLPKTDFLSTEDINSVYFEGFEKHQVYRAYKPGAKEFSTELDCYKDLLVLMTMIFTLTSKE
jgi:hypothetical protein